MRKPQVAIIGHVCIDHNISEHTEYTNWGSSALYMADYYQTELGLTPCVSTTYGPELLPYVKHFKLLPPEPQAASTMSNENHTRGSKRIFYSHNTKGSVPPAITPELIELIADADMLILGSLLANYDATYLAELLGHTKSSCLKAVTLQGYLREIDEHGLIHPRDFVEAGGILPFFDIAVLSDDDHPQAHEVASDWKKKSPLTNIIVTEGPLGASVIENSMSYNIPTSPVPPKDIIDSVGCGDVFSAALFYQYHQTRNLQTAIKAAHLAARSKLVTQR